jgi:hypothetical protein
MTTTLEYTYNRTNNELTDIQVLDAYAKAQEAITEGEKTKARLAARVEQIRQSMGGKKYTYIAGYIINHHERNDRHVPIEQLENQYPSAYNALVRYSTPEWNVVKATN